MARGLLLSEAGMRRNGACGRRPPQSTRRGGTQRRDSRSTASADVTQGGSVVQELKIAVTVRQMALAGMLGLCGAWAATGAAQTEGTSKASRAEFLSPVGTKLDQAGIHPEINLVQFWLGNPSLGERVHEQEALTLIAVGADLNLHKIARIPGATVHFEELFVPATADLEYGGYVADEIGGQPPPYIPEVYHLTWFTWDQTLVENRLRFEIGKANPGRYFAKTVCNQEFTCQSPLLQYEGGAGVNPAPYANWLGRVVVNVTPSLQLQAAEWRSTAAFPWTNGWEWNKTATDSNIYAFDASYRTPNPMDPRAKNYELLFTHNTATQVDPYTHATEHGVSGLYMGGKQAFWVGGARKAPVPQSLSAFASTNIAFSEHNTTGLTATANWGVLANGPFAKRPFDSYSLKMTWMRETPNEQLYLKAQNVAAGGDGKIAGRDSIGIGPDANFILSKSVILSPYMVHTFHANTMMAPTYGGKMQDGWTGGVLFVFLLDKMTGMAR